MTTVGIRYRNGLLWRHVEVEYPKSWEDLTQQQFIDIAGIITKSQVNYSDSIFIVNSLMGMKKRPLFNFPEDFSQLNSFIFDIKEPFSKMFVQYIEVPRIKMYGPLSGFMNMKIGEFAFADTYFMLYLQNHYTELLDKMISAIYRPRVKDIDITASDYKGDVRESFNENILDYRAKLVNKIPRAVKEAILFNYRIIRKWIELKYPYVFPKGEEKTVIKFGSSDPGWDKFLRSLCNGDLTKLDMVSDQYLHNVLAEANDAILEQQKDK